MSPHVWRIRPWLRSVHVETLLLLAAAAACGGGPEDPEDTVVASVTVAPAADTIAIGEQLTLTATARNAGGLVIPSATFTWSTAKGTVATVVNGTVTGVGSGDADILATAGGKSGSATITVTGLPAGTVSLSAARIALPPGSRAHLRATVRDASGTEIPNATVVWSASAPAVADVDGEGLVSATSAGTGLIFATSGAVTDSAEVTVTLLNYTFLAASDHTCGVATTGDAYCWGQGTKGELGHGRNDTVPIPVPVLAPHTWLQIVPGGQQTCGISSTRYLFCLGNGQLAGVGDPDTTSYFTPQPVAAPQLFRTVAATWSHACAVTIDSVAHCWGTNFQGRLGTGDLSDWLSVPKPVQGGIAFGTIAVSGSGLTCGVASGGTYCWGIQNELGQVGIGSWDLDTLRDAPELVVGGHSFTTVRVGEQHVCALTTTGAAYCWGSNVGWELGANAPDTCVFGWSCSTSPLAVSGGKTFRDIAVGFRTTCGVDTAGDIFCWGDLARDGMPDSTLTPVTTGMDFTAITSSENHVCALTSANVAYCWGENWGGQLGVGDRVGRTTPTKVAGQP